MRARALTDRREALIEAFPNCAEETLHARWRPAAERLMANWLGQLRPVALHSGSLFPAKAEHPVTRAPR